MLCSPHKMQLPRGLSRSKLAAAAVLVSCSFPACTSAQQCSTPVTTIRNNADATALAPCATFTGDIEFSPDATGAISLPGLQTLKGHLLVDSADGLESLSADSLREVDGYVFLQSLPDLESLDFPKLTSIYDQLRLVDLPKLSTLGFDSTLSECPLFTISGTGLTTLEGIDPVGTTSGFNVTNNENLQNITMSLKSTRATETSRVTIMFNSAGLKVSFPNLETSQSLDLANLTSLALPALMDSYELLLRDNTFPTFSAPKLASVGNGTRGILVQNSQGLTDLDFPSLFTTGGLTIRSNSRLETISMEKLQISPVGVILEGSFSNVSFPDLQKVEQFIVNTTSSKFDCSTLEAYQHDNVIASLRCTTPGIVSASTNPPPSTGLSFGTKVGIGAGVGGAVVLGAILVVLLCCKSRRERRAEGEEHGPSSAANMQEGYNKESPPLYESVAQMPKGGTTQEHQFDGKGGAQETFRGVNELEASNQVFELQANREFVEMG